MKNRPKVHSVLSVINSNRFCEFLQEKPTLGNDDMVQGHTILKGMGAQWYNRTSSSLHN